MDPNDFMKDLANITVALEQAVASGDIKDLAGAQDELMRLRTATDAIIMKVERTMNIKNALTKWKSAQTVEEKEESAIALGNAIIWDDFKVAWSKACLAVVTNSLWVKSGGMQSCLLPECEVTDKAGREWVCTFNRKESVADDGGGAD